VENQIIRHYCKTFSERNFINAKALRPEKSHLLYLQGIKNFLSNSSILDSMICSEIIAQHELLVWKINNQALQWP